MQDVYNYDSMFELMRRYSNLGKVERKIIEYLFPETYVKISRTELAKTIKADPSDTGKAIDSLEKRGIVRIVRKYNEDDAKSHKVNPMIACYILEGWLNNLLFMDINK